MQFNGLTPLGTNLNKKVIQPFLAAGVNGHNLAKPILVRVGACLPVADKSATQVAHAAPCNGGKRHSR